jgi:ribosomal protein S18 acetylase RimI-like enzyme
MEVTSVTYCPASDVDLGEFAAAFNRAYRDYYVPITMTTPGLRALVARDDIVLEASIVARRDERIVGMGLLGIRGDAGWIGGMGVIPTYRRQGIGREIMRRLLAEGIRRALRIIRLEVIADNAPAHALYGEFGFKDVRLLHVLHRLPAPLPAAASNEVAETDTVEALLQHYDLFHDVRNCWQRGRRSLAGLAEQIGGWAARDGTELLGYAVGWASRAEIRLADLATKPGSNRRGVASALLAHLHRQYPEACGLHYNVGEDDPAWQGYAALGYTSSLRQYEMEYQVRAP